MKISDINKKTYLKDIIRAYPEVKEFFKKYGLKCLSCKGIKQEIIREACHMHGINVDKFIKELKIFLESLDGTQRNLSKNKTR
ncbi:MAG TPA: DUF1858 domain-containing protein [Aquificae bacterium]|nr:DUF1858 domain-containing protein [Aquificota bacterium]